MEQRLPALEALRQGFASLDLADHLEGFSGMELAALFSGTQYLDVDQLIACFKLEDDGAAVQHVLQWLELFVRSLSETSIKVLLARVTNQLTLPKPGYCITIAIDDTTSQPTFYPNACHIQVPKCATYEVFAARLAASLRLGEHHMRTDAEQEHRLTQTEEQAVVAAMHGEIKAGGYYKRACGLVYTVGECGGPMESAVCPRCGKYIGGTQHRLENGNQHDAYDGTHTAAWPQ